MLPFSTCLLSSAFATRQPDHWIRAWAKLLASSGMLSVLLLSGAGISVAQTAHFSSAQATVASGFSYPWGIAVDSSGNIYVSDTGTRSVKEILAVNGRIPSSPTIRTLASGFGQNAGIAVDSAGDVYVADIQETVKEILAVNGSVPNSPTVITLGNGFINPSGVAVDSSGNVYVANFTDSSVNNDSSVKEMLAVNGSIPASPTIRTLGNGFAGPIDVVVDRSGNVFVADSLNHSVDEILAVNGAIPDSPTIRILGSGFFYPGSIAVDGSGNVYVADAGNNEIYEMLAVNGSIPTSPTIKILGSGFVDPEGVALDAKDNVFISDYINDRVVELSTSGWDFGATNIGTSSPVIPLTFTFDTAGTLGSTAVLTQGMAGLDFADAGSDTCVANTAYTAGQTCTMNVSFTPKFAGTRYGAAILKDVNGNVIATGNLQGTGVGPQVGFSPGTESTIVSTGLHTPEGVAVDAGGNVYIMDTNNSRLLKATLSAGGYSLSTVTTGLLVAYNVAVDGAGNLYVADTGNQRVLKETPSAAGYSETTIASGFGYPTGIAVDGSGSVYAADQLNGRILKLTLSATGYSQSTAVSGVPNVFGVAVDLGGNLYIADPGNLAVYKETSTANGYVQSTLPTSSQVSAQSIAVDALGNVYFEDAHTNDIFKETPSASGYVESLAVSDLQQIIGPFGVAVDGAGDLYIGYPPANSVVKVTHSSPPALTFAPASVGSTSTDSPQSVMLTNIGNADLTFPIPATGNNPSIAANFSLDSSGPSSCPLISSGSYAPGTLAAGASCELPISFTPTTAGTLTGSLVLTDNNLNAGPGYAAQSITLNGVATPGTPTITWPTPASIAFGTALSSTQLNATANVPGTFVYNPAAGTVPAQGTDVLSVTFTPTDTADYTTATKSVSLTVTPDIPAAMLTPTPGTQLTGTTATFTWSTGSGVTAYQLRVGTTGVGSSNLYYLSPTTNTSATVTGLPSNGAKIYVRLWSLINGVYKSTDYTYTAYGAPTPAAMLTPTPGTQLTGTTATFTWSTGSGVTAYQLRVGTTGVGSSNLYYLSPTTNTSATVTGLPSNGTKIYVRLWSLINGVYQSTDYTYTAYGAPTPAAMLTPTPGTQLTGTTATFTWSTGSGVTAYQLRVGTTGVGSSNLYYLSPTTNTSATVTGLPSNGTKIYVRLWSLINGVYQSTDYIYTAYGAPTPAAMLTPTPGTQLTGTTATFTWSTGSGVTAYQLRVGTTGVGSSNLYYLSPTTNTSATVTGLPSNGTKIYVRLWSLINGVYQSTDYTYTAFLEQ